MPPKNQQTSWVKNGKRTYYKKNKGKWVPQKKAVKKAVRKVRQKTELKDRINIVRTHDLTTSVGSVANGPAGAHIMCPESFLTAMTQGNLNGQFEGNSYTPKYLNMKVKLNFENLNPMGDVSGETEQTYFIQCMQGWIKINLKDSGALSDTHANASSGKNQPAFAHAADPHALAISVAKRALFTANMKKDFLSYERVDYGDVKVIRRFRVYGDQRKKFVTPMQVATTAPATATKAINSVAPDKHLSFNWKMQNKKQELAPITGATATYGNAETWIPFVMITFSADEALYGGSKLQIDWRDHFTYSDM
jgi:hypothetical protein